MASLMLSLGNFPSPPPGEGVPPGAEARAASLLALRKELLGERANDGQGDPEDFWEQCERLSAAWCSSADELWLLEGPEEERLLRGDSSVAESPFERACLPPANRRHLPVYGPLNTTTPYWEAGFGTQADAYPRWPLFGQHAHRPIALGGVFMESSKGSIPHIMASWVREGKVVEGDRVVVKAVRAKHGLWAIPCSASVEGNLDALRAAMGWTAVYFEAMPEAFLIQGEIAMEHEYRIFFVDGIPLTGAGCIEEYTPLFNRGAAFDPRTRRNRGVTLSSTEEEFPEPGIPSSVEGSPNLVEAYVALAREIGPQLPVPTCAVDFACVPEVKEICIIEANTLGNSGLYASQPGLVAEAMVKR